MSHHHAEIQHEEAEPESFWISVSAVITVVLLIVVLVGSVYYFKWTVSEEKTAKENTPVPYDLHKVRLYEDEQLNTLHWLDKDKKTVKITVDMAMKHVVASYQSR